MKVTVIGAGYVGLVTGACLADLGHHVVCLDKDVDRIQRLREGQCPIYEPGLREMMQRQLANGQLAFTDDPAQALRHGDVVFIAVGTPPLEDGSADLSHVLAAADMIGQHMQGPFQLIVTKSTVPVGTGQRVRQTLQAALAQRSLPDLAFDVVSNPEFLKEGAAIDDFMHPDRIVVGLDDGIHQARSRRIMEDLYSRLNRHHERMVWMDICSAELTKYAANAMLAVRISFMNEIALLAERMGADVDKVRRGIGSDSRIGHSFLYAGCGYGGSCFPKDTRALLRMGDWHGLPMQVVRACEEVNARQKYLLVTRLIEQLGSDLRGKTIAMWGLAFKPNTDDMREAPSRTMVRELLLRGAKVQAFDPVAGDEARKALAMDMVDAPACLQNFELKNHAMQAAQDADALMIVTEWKNFVNPAFAALRQALRQPLVLDGRNMYEPQAMHRLGFVYISVGRSTPHDRHDQSDSAPMAVHAAAAP